MGSKAYVIPFTVGQRTSIITRMGIIDEAPNFEVETTSTDRPSKEMETDGVFNYTSADDSDESAPQNRAGVANNRVVLASLVFVTVASLVFGIATTLKNVSAPFQTASGKELKDEDLVAEQGPSVESLKASDTDGDTLSDYDESMIYKTSPYLKDTDGDGFDDKQEIATGHDPICATGKPCVKQEKAVGDGGQEDTPLAAEGGEQSRTAFDPKQYVDASSQDPFSKLERLSPAQVRQMLIEKGMSQAQAQSIPEDTLMELYTQTIEETKASAKGVQDYSNLGAQGGPQVEPQGGVGAQPTAGQIRDMLRQTGKVTEQQLEQLSDEQLLQLYQQALAAQAQSTGQK